MQVLFVPSLGLDLSLLERLAASVDFPVKYKVAFCNGPVGALEPFRDAHPDWIIKDSPIGNRGVAGSWNDCADWFSAEPCWLIMNEDAHFLPGQLEQICMAADEYHGVAPIIYLNETEAYYCFVWTQLGRQFVGKFDENFWPAYYEDLDYRIRLRAAGFVDLPQALSHKTPVPHGKPRTGGVDYSAMIQGCGLLNRAYWHKKWGCEPPKNVYGYPYKDHRLTHQDVVWYPEERAARFPLWRAFIEKPNPSIYD